MLKKDATCKKIEREKKVEKKIKRRKDRKIKREG